MINKLAALKDNVSLRPHQVSAVNFIEHNKKGILAHGTGLGKTLTSIAAFEKLKERGEAGRALVIVPASLRSNYVKNIKQFTNSTYSVYGPKNEQSSKKVDDPSNTDYNIISYELFKQDPQGIKDRLGADTLIIDEVHRARNEASGTNRELAEHAPSYRNVITLTGSVVNNAPSDISPLMDATFGTKGNPLGTRSDFNRKYTTKVRKGGGFLSRKQEALTTMNNRKQLANALSGKVHYVSHTDIERSLPPVQEETVKVPMTDEQKKLYMYAFKDLPPITRANIRRNIPVSQKEMSSLFSKLMMSRKVMTDPAAMDTRYMGQDPYVYSPKVRRVIDDMSLHLSESPSNKVVVYGNLLGSQLDTVSYVLNMRNVPYSTYFGTGNKGNSSKDREKSLKDYMSGKSRVLLISGAGGEGLDLKGTSMLQMLEGHYNPEKIQQAEARVRRMGDNPDKPIQIKQYVSTIKPGGMDKFMNIFGRKYPTSIDEYIYTVADKKDRLNQDFRDSLVNKVASYATDSEFENKYAKISFSKLKAMVGNSIPVFHLTTPSNYQGIIASKGTIYSPAESYARGLAKTFPHTGMRANNAGRSSLSIIGDRAMLSRKVIDKTNIDPSLMKYVDNKDAAGKFKLVEKTLTQQGISSIPQNIYLAEGTPLMRYGDAGVMTGKNMVKGQILGSGAHIGVAPEFVYHNDKLTGVMLPQAKGTLIYDPLKVDRATAKEFKDAGGIAINSRFRRLLKAYNKNRSTT